MQAAVGRSLEGTSPARGRGREAGNDGGKAGSGGCFVEEVGGRADQCPQTQAFSISLQRTGGGRSWQPYPESLWKVGQGREEAHPAVHISQSSQVLIRWGHTSGATQGPQNPVHLARLCTHHLAQDNILSPGTAKPVKAVWSLLPCQVKNRRILWPHTHCTDGETESTGDIPLFQGPAVDTGARIGTSRKTIARFINLGQYHCRYSFETLKMCWL